MTVKEKVYNFVKKEKLIEESDNLLLAVSGGKDSIFMLNIILKLKKRLRINKLGVIHINHSLRGEDSYKDEMFVRRLAQKKGLEYFSEKVEVKNIALEEKKSLEAVGREYRYKFFEKYSSENDYNKIATAHTKNDQIETLLMRIINGTGLKGFRGIPSRRDKIIRPILNISTDEIMTYINKKNLKYREDYTNVLNKYDRNRIRNQIIPLIKELNPGFSDSMIRFKKIISDARSYIKQSVKKEVSKHFKLKSNIYSLDIKKIEEYLRKEILYYIFNNEFKETISYDKITDILQLVENDTSGKRIDISEDIQVHYNYNRLYFSNSLDFFTEYEFDLNLGDNSLGKYNLDVTVEKNESLPVKIKTNELFIPVDLLAEESLKIRTRKHGDVFVPERTGKHRKLKKYFNDIKLPRVYRDKVLMVADEKKIYAILNIEKSIYVDVRNRGPYLRIKYDFKKSGGEYEYNGAVIKK